jgi:hypothetical protein
VVSRPYFETMRVTLLAGRGFNVHDREGSEAVAVINDVLAREYSLESDPPERVCASVRAQRTRRLQDET